MNYITHIQRPSWCTTIPLSAAGCCIIVGDHVLMIQRGPARTFPGEYEVPGGKLEAGETPQEAAIRETIEEVGIDVRAYVTAAGTLYTAPVTNPKVIDYEFHVFCAILPERPPVILESGHIDFRWVTPQEALALPYIVGTPEVLLLCGLMNHTT